MALDEINWPSDLSDERKLNALYSPLPAIGVNPEGYASKISFWKNAINSYCIASQKSSFSTDVMMNAFQRANNKHPHCLLTVISEMTKAKELILVEEFLAMEPNVKRDLNWSKLAWDIAYTPISFTCNKVRNILWKPTPQQKTYIHVNALKVKAEKILQCAKGKDLILFSEIVHNCEDKEMSAQDALLCLHQLVLEKKVAVKLLEENTPIKGTDDEKLNLMTSPSKVLVKIAKLDDIDIYITDVDIGKYKLLKTIDQIELKIAEYEKLSGDAKSEAILHLKKGSKSLAALQLKKKKRYSYIIEENAKTLNNLYGLVETVNKTESNIEVAKTLKTANIVIKNFMKESNLNLDSVEELMDDVKDTVDMEKEISSVLSQSVGHDNDDQDFEEELEQLKEDLRAEDDLCKWVDKLKLPDLPAEPKLDTPAAPVPEGQDQN